MRRLTLTIASILAATLVAMGLQTAPPQEGTQTIGGTVTRADTGAVLHGARLELVRTDYQRLSTGYEKPCKPEPKSESSESRRFAATDDKGKFTFAGIIPGEYYLYTENEGFLKSAYGQRGAFPIPTVLKIGVPEDMESAFSSSNSPRDAQPPRAARGQPLPPGTTRATVDYTSSARAPALMLQDLKISITPAPTIAGMVFDEKGITLAAASVQLYQFRYTPLNGRTLKSVRATLTDDEGKYRLFWLDPGRYIVAGGHSDYGLQPWKQGLSLTPNLPNADSGYPMIFYPSSTTAPNAVYVPLNPGSQPIADVARRSREPFKTLPDNPSMKRPSFLFPTRREGIVLTNIASWPLPPTASSPWAVSRPASTSCLPGRP
jgi:protocatechuate 3,4-dioxygenase beta subunit